MAAAARGGSRGIRSPPVVVPVDAQRVPQTAQIMKRHEESERQRELEVLQNYKQRRAATVRRFSRLQ